MDLTGIENEAEFFPAGTLSDVLKHELEDIGVRWSGLEKSLHPVERLGQLAATHESLLRQIRNTQDAEKREALYRKRNHALISALGYEYRNHSVFTAGEPPKRIPLLAAAADREGRQALWILATPLTDLTEDSADPLGLSFSAEQFSEDEQGEAETNEPLEALIMEGIFALPDAPRHLLLISATQLVLVDQRKWLSRAVLRFDLDEIFARQDIDTYRIMACLVAREARLPEQGTPIADRLEEEAQRNANAVTHSLKRTVRDAIEILGQEVLDVCDGRYPAGPRRGVWIEGPALSLECLRYMYRLLFLFYAEANPRLRILDLKDPVYASGYSIEALRDLESVRLRTPAEKNGTYLWDSLQRTLGLIYAGEPHLLKLPAVKVSLLDPASTPLLGAVRLRNEAVQKIIRLLSLRKNSKGTARISYAKLGIGQLGAVYETLISFTGVVAKTDLIELKPEAINKASAESGSDTAQETNADDSDAAELTEGLFDAGTDPDRVPDPDAAFGEGGMQPTAQRKDTVDLLAPSYFVPRSRIHEFNPEAIVFDGAEARIYPQGRFIYRLAGRDREKSASYYTPEPLARLLVKQALTERCRDMSADEILELKVLEPAMGSAAFLVEATNQLADLYLTKKQAETGSTLPQEQVVEEKQKVRAYIADRNCFGVDLNPVAMELGAISLWLNGLHASEFSPWFGDQLHTGNSLIGARRAAYAPSTLTAKKQTDLWLKQPPTELGWHTPLPEGHVWQWLLPAADMAAFEKDKTISAFAGDEQAHIKAWRKQGFFARLEPHEVALAQRLSRVADQLFMEVADALAKTRAEANDAITLWPGREMAGASQTDYRTKAALIERLSGEDHARNTLPFKRLKTAMDAWCALWLWPLEAAEALPSRAEFLQGMSMLLEGGFSEDGTLAAPATDLFGPRQGDLLHGLSVQDAEAAPPKTGQAVLFRETNVEALIEHFEWLEVATRVAARERFVHFELLFADVMRARGGFDLIVGNPPWAKPNWNEGDVLTDIDPLYAGYSASEVKKLLPAALARTKRHREFLSTFVSTRGAMKVTASEVMNPFAGEGSNNLYRCFIDLGFRLVAPEGRLALIHQDGHLGDPKSGAFRRHWYTRVERHFEFRNEMRQKNFAEVHNETLFSLNTYRGTPSEIRFIQFTNAFLASQIEDSFADADGLGDVPGVKGSDGKWDTRGHRERLITIDREALAVIHSLAEEAEVPLEETRFIQPFTRKTLEVFKQLATFPKLGRVMGAQSDEAGPEGAAPNAATAVGWQMSPHWNETAAQKDGTIQRVTAFRPLEQMVIQGPMFHVGNPLYKTPRDNSKTNRDYDVIDLTRIPDDYLPRTNYGPAVDMTEYHRRATRCAWDKSKLHADFYRVGFREMIALNGERSLIAALFPPKLHHIFTIQTVAFHDQRDLLHFLPTSMSLVLDGLFKMTGRAHLQPETAKSLPTCRPGNQAILRALLLCCLTTSYAPLWNSVRLALGTLSWSKDDSKLETPDTIRTWHHNMPLRQDFARRLALVEIDVLVAHAFGLSLEDLIEIYRIHFPVLQENEAGTWYDQQGRIVWTCSKGLPGVGYLDERGKSPGRRQWEALVAEEPAELTCEAVDNTQPGGPQPYTRRFVGPFFTCDRVEDYRRAWAHFASGGRGAHA